MLFYIITAEVSVEKIVDIFFQSKNTSKLLLQNFVKKKTIF